MYYIELLKMADINNVASIFLRQYNNTEDIPCLFRRRVLSDQTVGVQSPTERKRFCESPLLVKSRALNHLPRKRLIRRKLRNRIKKAVDDILNCQVEFSDDMIIQLEDINDDDGIFQYVDVSGFEAKTDTVYSQVATPWPKIAGYPVDESSAAAYGTDKTAALVLWEITFLEFDNDTIQKKVAGW